MNYYSSKKSSDNFAKKLVYSPILPKHLVRSKKTQEALQKSQEFYKENVENEKLLLEQQISYKQKEAMRPPVEKPSNIITLKNDTQWYFDTNLNKFVNVVTKEELTISEFHRYTTLVALNVFKDIDVPDGSVSDRFGIKTVTIIPTTPNANDSDSARADVQMYSGKAGVSFTYRWTYDTTLNPLITS